MLVRKHVKDINKAHFVGEKVEYTAQEIVDEPFDNLADLFNLDQLDDLEEAVRLDMELNR